MFDLDAARVFILKCKIHLGARPIFRVVFPPRPSRVKQKKKKKGVLRWFTGTCVVVPQFIFFLLIGFVLINGCSRMDVTRRIWIFGGPGQSVAAEPRSHAIKFGDLVWRTNSQLDLPRQTRATLIGAAFPPDTPQGFWARRRCGPTLVCGRRTSAGGEGCTGETNGADGPSTIRLGKSAVVAVHGRHANHWDRRRPVLHNRRPDVRANNSSRYGDGSRKIRWALCPGNGPLPRPPDRGRELPSEPASVTRTNGGW